MPYYLSKYTGSGKDRDACRPYGSDQPGWSTIDLRADGGATPGGNGLNCCLLHLPIHVNDPNLFQIADVKGETIPPLVRAGMAARLNATLNYSRLDDLVADLLVRPPGNAWNPLDVGTYKIHLGGELSPRPSFYPMASCRYIESWTHADSASALTADLTWTLLVGTAWGIVSNQAKVSGAVFTQRAYPNVDTDTNDNIVNGTLVSIGGTGFMGLMCRLTVASLNNYHLTAACGTSGGPDYRMEKRVAGTTTTLSTTVVTPVAGDVMECSAIGSTIQGKFNSTVVGPVTDSAITAGTRCGLDCYTTGAGDSFVIDDLTFRDSISQCRPETLQYPSYMGVM